MTLAKSANPLNILFVLPGLGNGGQERQLCELSIGLVNRGHRVDVVVGYPGDFYEAHLNANGVRVIALRHRTREIAKMSMRERAIEALLRLWKLRRVIAQGKYDIVHGYGDSSNAYVSFTDGLRHRPGLVWGVRASEGTGNRFSELVTPVISRRVDLVIPNSHAGAKYIQAMGCKPRATQVIPNGIDVDRCDIDLAARAEMRGRLGIADDERLIGIIGNFHPRKGIQIFLEAASKVDPALKCRFLVLGGDYWGKRDELDATVAGLGLEDKVIFHPLVSDVERYMNALDLIVSASFTEGFSNVLAEAMSCGVPCVATDVGDSRSILGDLGILVPPGDAAAMARAIETSLTSPRIDRQVLRAAITGAFTIPHLIDRTERAFRDVLGHP